MQASACTNSVKSMRLTSKECTQNHGKNVLDTVDLEPLWCCVLCEEESWRERNSVLSMLAVRRTKCRGGWFEARSV